MKQEEKVKAASARLLRTAGSAVETKLASLRQRFALAARLVPPFTPLRRGRFSARKGASLFASSVSVYDREANAYR